MRTAFQDRTWPREDTWHQVVFSLSQARRALPYVNLIVRDACEAFHMAQRCRAALEGSLPARMATDLSARRDNALHRLSAAVDDCNAAGVDLVDIRSGLARFAARIEGRPVSLLWRLGDPIDHAWEDLDGVELVAAT